MAEMPSKVEFDVYMVPKGSFLSSSRAGTVHLGTVVVEPRAIDSADVASQVSELLQQQTDGQVTDREFLARKGGEEFADDVERHSARVADDVARITGTGIREVPS